MVIVSETLPFCNIDLIDGCIRIFNCDIPEEDLKWHFDEEDRTITVLEGNNWKFQFDDELPINLTKNTIININKGIYHRVIKGTSPLVVKIKKHGIN